MFPVCKLPANSGSNLAGGNFLNTGSSAYYSGLAQVGQNLGREVTVQGDVFPSSPSPPSYGEATGISRASSFSESDEGSVSGTFAEELGSPLGQRSCLTVFPTVVSEPAVVSNAVEGERGHGGVSADYVDSEGSVDRDHRGCSDYFCYCGDLGGCGDLDLAAGCGEVPTGCGEVLTGCCEAAAGCCEVAATGCFQVAIGFCELVGALLEGI